MNRKKISRILSMVLVMGMIAAIPASTQTLSEPGGESSDSSNLPMLILVNRLELSEEQMEELRDILTGLLEEKEGMDALRSEFEESMISFNGTGEELDELLSEFREDQATLADAMRESIETSLDEVRDLLSINQGIALREVLPRLLERGASLQPGRGASRLQNTPEMMGNRMPSLPMGRDFSSNLGQMGNRAGNTMTERGAMRQLRGRGQFSGNSLPLQPLQSIQGGRLGEHGSLFELLKQVAEVLELKLGAME